MDTSIAYRKCYQGKMGQRMLVAPVRKMSTNDLFELSLDHAGWSPANHHHHHHHHHHCISTLNSYCHLTAYKAGCGRLRGISTARMARRGLT